MTTTLSCPFCSSGMKILSKGEATDLLVGSLINPRSSIANLLKGAMPKGGGGNSGDVKQCGECGFIALFSK